MLLNKYYVIVHGLKNYVIVLKKTSRAGSAHSGGTRKKYTRGGPRIQGGGEHVKIAYQFHAASTRRDKNTRLAWKSYASNGITLLACM